jgi:hypothetical protein
MSENPRVMTYWVEKYRCPVTLILTDGRAMSGDIFLHSISRFRVAPQQAAEFFNAPEPFFVFAPTYDERVMVAKASVAVIEAPLPTSDDDEHLDKARVAVGVEIDITGDMTTAGWFFHHATEGKARLQDYLNDFKEQFIVLFDAEKTTLVNRNSVAHVRETV